MVSNLAEAGHDAETVVKEGMAGVPDSHLLEVMQQESCILLTLDKGIAGIVLFRPNSMGRGEVLKFVRRHLHEVLQLELKGRLVVVTTGGLRFR